MDKDTQKVKTLSIYVKGMEDELLAQLQYLQDELGVRSKSAAIKTAVNHLVCALKEAEREENSK